MNKRKLHHFLTQFRRVQYFILINPEKEQVEIWELIDEKYDEKIVESDFIFSPESNCNAKIIWSEIWA